MSILDTYVMALCALVMSGFVHFSALTCIAPQRIACIHTYVLDTRCDYLFFFSFRFFSRSILRATTTTTAAVARRARCDRLDWLWLVAAAAEQRVHSSQPSYTSACTVVMVLVSTRVRIPTRGAPGLRGDPWCPRLAARLSSP